MPGRSDNEQILEETVLCDIADIKRSRRQTWARDELLRKAKDGGKYGERDAVEAAVLARLVRVLGYEDAVIAWRSVRGQLAGTSTGARVEVVYDMTAKEAVVAVEDGQVAAFARRGHLMHLVALDEVIAEVRAAYARVRETKLAREQARQRAALPHWRG